MPFFFGLKTCALYAFCGFKLACSLQPSRFQPETAKNYFDCFAPACASSRSIPAA